MKAFLLLLLLPLGLSAQAQFCIKNETTSNNYQYRVQYTCPDNPDINVWTTWYKIGAGPEVNACIADEDFKCPGDWAAKTIEVRTGTSNNMVSIKFPATYPGETKRLIDAQNDNLTGNLVWEFMNTVRIY